MNSVALTKDTAEILAIKWYNNPGCLSKEEFLEDYNRTKYIKKLFETYLKKGILKERLILNHFTIFFNVFDIEPATRLLYFKLEPKYWRMLKSFLVFLNYHRDDVFDGIDTKNIETDDVILAQLHKI